MYKMFACHRIVVMRDGRHAKFVGEAIQAKSWDDAQKIADSRGKGGRVDGIYG